MSITNKRQDNFFDICGQCKIHCCKNARPPITSKRRKIIEEYLKEQKVPIENAFVQVSYTFPKEDTEGCCVFYDKKTRKCLVHPVKPETCVAGPITFDINAKSKKIEWYLKMEEICPLAGVMHENKEAFQMHLESAKKEILRLVHELDTKALQTILKIEEPETFKIDEDVLEKDILDKLTKF